MNPNVNNGLWMIMCQCMFSDGNECVTLVGDVDNREAGVGARCGNSLYFQVNISA